jgi:hypothetical protein
LGGFFQQSVFGCGYEDVNDAERFFAETRRCVDGRR